MNSGAKAPKGIARNTFVKWYSQFNDEDKWVIDKLLPHCRFYYFNKIQNNIKKLYKKLIKEYEIDPSSTLFVPVGYVANSGLTIAHLFKNMNNIEEKRINLLLNDLTVDVIMENKYVVFLDDFIGTGRYFGKIFDEYVAYQPKKIRDSVKFIYACLVGLQQGIDVSTKEGLDLCVVEKISPEMQPFHEKSTIFSMDEKERAREIMVRYNFPLDQLFPLGYMDAQGLIGFQFGTPNASFPIFWSQANGWTPLFPSGRYLRDLGKTVPFPEYMKKYHISSKMNSIDLQEKERIQEIIASFLPVTLQHIFYTISTQMMLDSNTIRFIIEMIKEFKNLEQTETHTTFSVMFIPNRIPDTLSKNAYLKDIKFELSDEKCASKIKKYVPFIDGNNSTLIIDKNGNGHAIKYSHAPLDAPFSKHAPIPHHDIAYTTHEGEGLLFLFGIKNNVCVYHDGYRIMIKKDDVWREQGILKDISEINHCNIRQPFFDRMMQIVYQLLHDTQSAFICLICPSDLREIISHIKKRSWNSYKHVDIFTENLVIKDIQIMAKLFSKKGATIINTLGEVINHSVFFNLSMLDCDDNSEESEIAMALSKKCRNTIIIVTSKSGTLTMYHRGSVFLKMDY